MRRLPALLLAAALAFAASVTIAGPAHAIDFGVNSTADSPDANPGDKICASVLDGLCTLRAAVMEIDALGKTSNNITIPAGRYVLSLGGADEDWGYTGDLDLRFSVNINGTAGSTNTFIVGGTGFGDRIFDIPTGTSPAVYITGVTIQTGAAPATTHENGGGIRDLGGASLIVQNVEIDSSTALGGSGGGLYAAGPAGSTLTVNGATGLKLNGMRQREGESDAGDGGRNGSLRHEDHGRYGQGRGSPEKQAAFQPIFTEAAS